MVLNWPRYRCLTCRWSGRKKRTAQPRKDAFLQNEVFQKGSKDPPTIQIGKSKAWWKTNSITDRIDRTLPLPQGRFVECTLGVEDGQWVVYISWITT
jgi:hypothetical protein